jgi:hypothetical protein
MLQSSWRKSDELFHARTTHRRFLSRYSPGGASAVLQELRDEQHFPGMQPVGTYPIHIIVKNGRTMLLGGVDNSLVVVREQR